MYVYKRALMGPLGIGIAFYQLDSKAVSFTYLY